MRRPAPAAARASLLQLQTGPVAWEVYAPACVLAPCSSGSRGEALASAPRLRLGLRDGAGQRHGLRHGVDHLGALAAASRAASIPWIASIACLDLLVAHRLDASAVLHLHLPRHQQNQQLQEHRRLLLHHFVDGRATASRKAGCISRMVSALRSRRAREEPPGFPETPGGNGRPTGMVRLATVFGMDGLGPCYQPRGCLIGGVFGRPRPSPSKPGLPW